MDFTYSDGLSMDLKKLISCIECHERSGNEQIILETLKTITDLCANESCGRDMFREVNGLDFLVEFVFTTDNTILLEHLLKALAFVIDENIHSQLYLTKKSVFEVIQTILKNHNFPVNVRKNAVLLASAILYQNSSAQSLISEIGLLDDMLHIFEQGAQRCLANDPCSTYLRGISSECWLMTNSALSFSVNNPQNERNQEKCSSIFHIAFKVLESSCDVEMISSVSTLLSFIISNNRTCQNKLHNCDALHMLTRCFKKFINSVISDVEEYDNLIGMGSLQAITFIVRIISVVAVDHEKNSALLGKLGVVSLMVKLLFVEALSIPVKTNLVLCLGHCIDACRSNMKYVIETENLDKLLKNYLQLGDTDLSFASKYLLQVCLFSNDPHLVCKDNTESIFLNARHRDESKPQSHSSMKRVSKNIKCNSNTCRPSTVASNRKSKRNSFESTDTIYHAMSCALNKQACDCKERPRNDFKFIHQNEVTSNSTVTNDKCPFKCSNKVIDSPKSAKKNFCFNPNKKDSTFDFLPVPRISSESEDSVYHSLNCALSMNFKNRKTCLSKSAFNVISLNQTLATIPESENQVMPNTFSPFSKTVGKRVLTDMTNLKSFAKKAKLDVSNTSSKLNQSPSNSSICSENVDITAISNKLQTGFSNASTPRLSKPEKQNLKSPSSVRSSRSSNRKRMNFSTQTCSKRSKLLERLPETFSFSDDSSDTNRDSNNYVQVIVFPGECCEDHNLISTFENLKVVSLE